MRFCFIPVALILLSTFTTARAEDEALQLKMDRTFMPSAAGADGTPIFISAQHLQGTGGNQIEASGVVEVRQGGQAIFADHLLLQQENKDLVADGSVRVEREGTVVRGPYLRLNLDSNAGNMAQPEFQFTDNNARASADSLRMEGKQNYILNNAVYTTCPAGDDDWLLKMGVLEIDRTRQVGIAHDARVEFMGVPILYTPWMDFSLGGRRKSGFLGPIFGGTGKGGLDVTLPFYWNIAPDRDATISPRIMAKRGLMFNDEFRYLRPTYFGEAHLDVLPADRIADRSRSRMALKHEHHLAAGLSGAIDVNRVSDDAYFRDLADAVNATSQTNLVREGMLSYSNSWWNAGARVQRFQTLQDPAAVVAVPYYRVPQISVGAHHSLAKSNVTFTGEYTEFNHPTAVNGQRIVAYPSISYQLLPKSAFNLTPKLGVHNTRYVLGENNLGGSSQYQRTVPIFSLDSGLVMERDWVMSEQSFVQTLEPRAYYVYIPYRDQSMLPNFDSAQADFNFAQMFTENRFFGNDRIGDANHVTLALTSRLLEQDSGAERLRLAIGERFSRETPQVNLVAPTSTTNKSDILFAASGQISRIWSLDSSFQYNPNQSHAEKFNMAARYQPESGKVLNLGYRFTRNSLRQVDISTQWPLFRRWHGMARWNYSLQDKRILEALTGLEYNQACWTLRLVAQRFATTAQETTTGLFVQLELNDLMRVGPDPLNVLRQSVPGYSKLNDAVADKPVQGLH